MKNNIRQLAVLISFSLLSIIGLQIYYAIEVYRQKSAVFHAEVNQAFEKAVDKTNEQRLRKINSFFEQDIGDTTQVKLTYEVSEEGPKLTVIDPVSGYKHLSVSTELLPDSLIKPSALIRIAVNKNWKLLRDESILYWTQTIGDRLKAYSDSLSISTDSLRHNMKTELLGFGIEEEFSFIKSDSSIAYDSTNLSFRIKMLPVKLDGETLLTAKIHNPQLAILKRLTAVFILSILALALLFLSIMGLYRVLKKQRHISVLKDDFIDNVTHELLTPTTTLQLALETLEKSDPLSSSKYIGIAKQHANRIASIVDQVLKNSLSQTDQESIKLEECDIISLIQDTENYYKATYGDQINIESNVEGSPTIVTNQGHLSTALHNVISNAIKYGHPIKPEIKISLETFSHAVLVCIKDNGLGIPKEHQKQIFEKFHRVPSTSHDVKGLGIGLYHAQMLMRKINGDVRLRSSSHRGSCFCIHLNKRIDHEN